MPLFLDCLYVNSSVLVERNCNQCCYEGALKAGKFSLLIIIINGLIILKIALNSLDN